MSGNTQYNQIADIYAKLYPPGGQTSPEFPIAAIEAHQLYLALHDPSIDVRGKRVLDLASGGGYYASKILSWGAASVTGVDISDAMLDVARQDARDRSIPEDKLRYLHGDAMDESLTIDGAPFDLVTGCWLLNYAWDAATMTKIWNFVGRNLKPGGVWIGLTTPPVLSDQPWVGKMLEYVMSPAGPWGRTGTGGKVLSPMPNGDGYKMLTELGIPGQQEIVSFENYNLTLKIFEESCANSAHFTGLEWRDHEIPDEAKVGQPVGYWNDLSLSPHCRICIARKKE